MDFYKNPHSKITGPDRKLLNLWDTLCQTRKMTGIGGLDVHAKKLFTKKFRFFPYKQLFNSILTHVLCEPMSGEAEKDLPALYDALINGRCFVAYDDLSPSGGFRFYGEIDDRKYNMGETIPYDNGLCLKIELPREAKVCIIKDGKRFETAYASSLSQPVQECGVYRIEAYVGAKPWVFSNPLYVRPK